MTAWHADEPEASTAWLDDADPAAQEFVAQVWDALASTSPNGIATAWLNASGILKDAMRGAVPPPPPSQPGPPTPQVPSDAQPSQELLAAALVWLDNRGFLERFAASLSEVLPRLWARAWSDGEAQARMFLTQMTPAMTAKDTGKKKPKGKKKRKKGATPPPPPPPPVVPPAQLLATLLATSASFVAWATGQALSAEVALIVASLAARVAQLLATASSQGWTAQRLAEALERAFMARWRAEMIAATEASRAQQAAMIAEYRSQGIRWVRWVTRHDDRVCKECKANEAKGTVRLGKKFPNGNVAPPAHPRCRCYLIPSSLWKRIIGKDSGPVLVKSGKKPWKASGTAQDKVYNQLLQDFPPKAIGWVRKAEWAGPVHVPFDQIEYQPDKWQAGHEHAKVSRIRKKISRQLAAGKMTHPIVMIDRPDSKRGTHLVVIDGHHRTIAFHQLGKPAIAWVGTVPSMAVAREAEETHTLQYREGHPGASGFAASKRSVTAAGIAIHARATGRILMLQRHLSGKDDDPHGGCWELPGGRLDDGEEPYDAAKREWCEETGCAFPDGDRGASWREGAYMGFVHHVLSEDAVPAFGGRDQVVNPDDPDGDETEALAWWDPADLDNPLVRPELAGSAGKLRSALGEEPDMDAAKVLRDAGWRYPHIARFLGVSEAEARDMVKRAKVSKESVDYREATLPTKACKNCAMYHGNGPTGTCDLVRGVIIPDDTCDRWVAMDIMNPPGGSAKSAETPVVSTVHHPLGHEGLWHTPSKKVPVLQQLPAYIQNTARALMRDHGTEESQAIATAVNAVKEWAAGRAFGGHVKVTPEVQAAARRALQEWDDLKATHH